MATNSRIQKQFSAAAAALGYAYQFRFALLTALRRQKTGLNWVLELEAADDLVVAGSNETALLQLKHRAPGSSITDASPDLWKTLRVWSEALTNGRIEIPSTQLLLVTTSTSPTGSVCARLTEDPQSRNNQAIATELRTIAQASQNASLTAAFDAYLSLTEDDAPRLVAAIQLIEDSPDIAQVEERIVEFARLMV